MVPQESALDAKGSQFTYEAPAYSVNILRVDVEGVEIVEEETAELPDPIVQYSFEAGNATDDSGNFQGTLQGGASIVAMSDGNKALYTGTANGNGFLT